MMKKTTFLVSTILCLVFAQFSYGQEINPQNSFVINKKITLNGTSETKEVILDVKPGYKTNVMIFDINCQLRANALSVEILSPNGKNFGDFFIENQVKYNEKNNEAINTRKYQERVTGQIHKIIKAEYGKWKIIIKPKGEVYGQIEINIKQFLPQE